MVYGKLHLSVGKNSKVYIGDYVTIRSSTKYNYVGINRPTSICVVPDAELYIGNFTGLSGAAIYASNKIRIGDYCNIGGNVSIWDTDFHPIDFKIRRDSLEGTVTRPVIIGDDVFLGANSLVIKGVTIGDRAIIGAGSVVSKDIPTAEIWAGNPAKYVKGLKND